MYRVHLNDEELAELRRRARDVATMPRTRDRLEMVRLCHAGWSAPRIARHLQQSPERVRYWLRRFLELGFAGLPDQPHVGQSSTLTPVIREALHREFAKADRTWTAGQVAEWLREHHHLALSTGWVRRLLKRERLSYKRTPRRLKHKQDPVQVETKRTELQALEKKGV